MSVTVDLGSPENFIIPVEDLAESRTGSITDKLLKHKDFDDDWDKIVLTFPGIKEYAFTKNDILTNAFGRYFDPTGTDGGVALGIPVEGKAYKILHGKFLSSTVNGSVIIIKAKIEPNLTNKMTIDQNYFNVADLIRNQGLDAYSEIQYWAVADMTDGSESKVISFTVPKSTIDAIASGSLSASEMGDYVDDLWIHPGLKK